MQQQIQANSSNLMHPESFNKMDGEHHLQSSHNRKPINIIFKNISYQVEIDKKTDQFQLPCHKEKQIKSILKDVTGIFKAGEISAILGASGAGKTSLLNIIACRASHTKGNLYANQFEYDYNSFGDFANYVMQTDVLMQTLTVRETLHFAADLKLDDTTEVKNKKIEHLTKSMKLENCLDVLVGGQLIKGISGGEKKRTSIAFQLISDPQVIMLDQPTSGLDSLTSFIIVDYLSKLAHQKGRTVLMTIHQPNTDIYKMFDRLFLMVEGRFVYQGAANQAVTYFSSNFGLKCGQFVNPAQFQIQIIHQENPLNVKRYPQYFQAYDDNQGPMVQREILSIAQIQIVKRQINVSTASMFCTLVKRDFLNIARNPMLFKSRLFQSILLGIYVGGVYFNAGQQDYTTQSGWYSIIGFFFFLCITSLMSALAPIALVFPLERAVFLKEQNSRLYSVLPYFLSRNAIQLPFLVIMPFAFILMFYWMMGLASTAQQFFLMYFISFLINLCGNSLGLLLGSVIQDAKAVSTAVPIILIPFILFSGLFKNTGNLPNWLGWIQYISPIKYGYIEFITNQVKYRASLISSMNFDVSFWPSIGLLIALSLGYRLLSLFFLWYLRTKIQ